MSARDGVPGPAQILRQVRLHLCRRFMRHRVQTRIAQERAMWNNARVALAKVRADKKAREATSNSCK